MRKKLTIKIDKDTKQLLKYISATFKAVEKNINMMIWEMED